MIRKSIARMQSKRLFIAIALTVMVLGTTNTTAEAVITIRVDTHLDSNSLRQCTPAPNDCSLRGAIRYAEERNVTDALIILPSQEWPRMYRLQLGQLVIRRSLSIRGGNRSTVIIDGLENGRVIYIEGESSPTVNITNVTIQNGKVESLSGGGIFVEQGAALTLTRSIVQHNKTVNTHQQPGGGIFNEGQLRIIESMITNNSVPLDAGGGSPRPAGGGIYNATGAQLLIEQSSILQNEASYGGGIANQGSMIIVNTTISSNTVSVAGGGIWNFSIGTGVIINSIITGNEKIVHPAEDAHELDQRGGGGIYNGESPSSGLSGSISMGNTILAENSADGLGNDCLSNTASEFTSRGGNLIGRIFESECNLVWLGSDQIGGITTDFSIDPMLQYVDFHGGSTLTYSLSSDSPAIDRGINGNCPATDQRGFVRPLDGDGDKIAQCDVGAFEAPPVPLDDFSFGGHPNGRLGENWAGNKTKANYFITNDGRLDVEAGGPIYWSADIFGNDQHAFIQLYRIDPHGVYLVLLKVQGIRDQGAIGVYYDARGQQIGISTFVPGQGLVTLRTFPGRVLRDGDVLGARAMSDGTVHVYVNWISLGSADAGDFFSDKIGRVGLWIANARGAELDDFVGATVAP